jgi:hypothetical protein
MQPLRSASNWLALYTSPAIIANSAGALYVFFMFLSLSLYGQRESLIVSYGRSIWRAVGSSVCTWRERERAKRNIRSVFDRSGATIVGARKIHGKTR